MDNYLANLQLLHEVLEYHATQVWKVFELLAKVKSSRYVLFMQQVQCVVGHVLCRGCFFADPTKTSATANWHWQHITAPKALKGCWGLAN